ncbi:MAG: hypothetical protein R3C12_20815 [Planctomycetaceae bacterium]
MFVLIAWGSRGPSPRLLSLWSDSRNDDCVHLPSPDPCGIISPINIRLKLTVPRMGGHHGHRGQGSDAGQATRERKFRGAAMADSFDGMTIREKLTEADRLMREK